ncbi:mucin-2 isoform X1 [Drosophila elegans]|uniref:mucin-2 isoform X1 n=1 Tax=Drosophila elegans TaxID=30023 RepID=UPI0007E79057|nr:mucin-2 isoform X1 [Drosophila elegans]XP_017134023.1 mucin-2 isoform X1 [Drosophila elegans]XP_041566640.1 mucin-2 isoform X1 [Drosophila elegans]
MTHCLWSTSLGMLALLALLSMVSSRSVRQLPNRYPPLLPAGYYGQSPYAYPPYGYGYQAPHFAINPPGTYFDNVYGVYKTYPGGGYPVRFDYNNRCSRNYIGIKPHPDQQQYYYVCKPNCVIFSKCRNLESFNSSSGRCVQHVPQHRPDHMLPQCQKEGRFPHPHDCKVYYRCDKNRTHPWLFACPEGTIFSPVERKCLPGDQCPSTEISESGSYIPQNCEIKFPECAEEGTFRSPTDCALYYTCRLQESGTYLQTRFKCPGSNSFDLERKLCRPRHEVDCLDYVSGPVPVPYHAPQAYYPPYPVAPLYEEDDYDTEAREQEPAIQSGKDPLFERPSVKIVVLPTTPATTTSKRTADYPSYEHTLHHSGKEPSLGSPKVQANEDSLRIKLSKNIVIMPTTPETTTIKSKLSTDTTKYQYKRYTYATTKDFVTETPQHKEVPTDFHLSKNIVIFPTTTTTTTTKPIASTCPTFPMPSTTRKSNTTTPKTSTVTDTTIKPTTTLRTSTTQKQNTTTPKTTTTQISTVDPKTTTTASTTTITAQKSTKSPNTSTVTTASQQPITTTLNTSTVTTTTQKPKTTSAKPNTTTQKSTTNSKTSTVASTTQQTTSTLTTTTPKRTTTTLKPITTTLKTTTVTTTTQKPITTTLISTTVTTSTQKPTTDTPKPTTTTQKSTTSQKSTAVTTTTQQPITNTTTQKSTTKTSTVTSTTQQPISTVTTTTTTTTPKTTIVTTTTQKPTTTTLKSTSVNTSTQKPTTDTPKPTTTTQKSTTSQKPTAVTTTTQQPMTSSLKTSTVTTTTRKPKTTTTQPNTTTQKSTTTPRTSTGTSTTQQSTSTVTTTTLKPITTTLKPTTTTLKTTTVTITTQNPITTTLNTSTGTTTTQNPTTDTPKQTTTIQKSTTSPKTTTVTVTTQQPITSSLKTSTVTTTTSSKPNTTTQKSTTTSKTSTATRTTKQTKSTATTTTFEPSITTLKPITTTRKTASVATTTQRPITTTLKSTSVTTTTQKPTTSKPTTDDLTTTPKLTTITHKPNTTTRKSTSVTATTTSIETSRSPTTQNSTTTELTTVTRPHCSDPDSTSDNNTNPACTQELQQVKQLKLHLPQHQEEHIHTQTNIEPIESRTILGGRDESDYLDDAPSSASGESRQETTAKAPSMSTLAAAHILRKLFHVISTTPSSREKAPRQRSPNVTLGQMARHNLATSKPFIAHSLRLSIQQLTSTQKRSIQPKAIVALNTTKKEPADYEYYDSRSAEQYVDEENEVLSRTQPKATSSSPSPVPSTTTVRELHETSSAPSQPKEVLISSTTAQPFQETTDDLEYRDNSGDSEYVNDDYPNASHVSENQIPGGINSREARKSFLLSLLKERLTQTEAQKPLETTTKADSLISSTSARPSSTRISITSTTTTPRMSRSTQSPTKPPTRAVQLPAKHSVYLSREYYDDDDNDDEYMEEDPSALSDTAKKDQGKDRGNVAKKSPTATAKRHIVLPLIQQPMETELATLNAKSVPSKTASDGLMFKGLAIRKSQFTTKSSLKRLPGTESVNSLANNIPILDIVGHSSRLTITPTLTSTSSLTKIKPKMQTTMPSRILRPAFTASTESSFPTLSSTFTEPLTTLQNRQKLREGEKHESKLEIITPTTSETLPTATGFAAVATSSAIVQSQTMLSVNSRPWLLAAINQTVHITPISSIAARAPSNPVSQVNRSFNPLVSSPEDYSTEKVPQLIVKVYEPIDLKIVFCPNSCDQSHDHKYDPADNYKKSNCTGDCDEEEERVHKHVDIQWKPQELGEIAAFRNTA